MDNEVKEFEGEHRFFSNKGIGKETKKSSANEPKIIDENEYVHLSISPPIHLPIDLISHLPTYPAIFPCIYLSVNL